MTDKEIIQALECCIKAKTNADCEALKCPFYDNEIDICMYVNNEEVLYANALDLINRQQAEIERLSNSAEQWEETAKDLLIGKEKDKAEIEKLKKLTKDRADVNFDKIVRVVDRARADIEAEAIKEFAEKLKEDLGIWSFDFTYYADRAEARGYIDNLVKEMVSEDN